MPIERSLGMTFIHLLIRFLGRRDLGLAFEAFPRDRGQVWALTGPAEVQRTGILTRVGSKERFRPYQTKF